jgi:hypothetical protein
MSRRTYLVVGERVSGMRRGGGDGSGPVEGALERAAVKELYEEVGELMESTVS